MRGSYVLDVVCGGDDSTVTACRVVVPSIKFIHDQGSTITANVLDARQLRIRHHPASRVPRVRRQDNTSTSRNLVANLLSMNVILVIMAEWNGNRSEILKQRQHLVVGRVVRDEESEVGVSEHGGDTDKSCAAAGHDADVFAGVLGRFAFAVVLVVKMGYGFAERFDAGCGTVLAACHGDVDAGRTLKADELAENTGFTLWTLTLKQPSMSSSTSGAPWPRLAQRVGSSAKPFL
jgi:hypothetical protein